jgi:hypothetical protein
MTGFVDECRREWKRLKVPDPVANEMAAELEGDLQDAEADGLSPEEVLGDGVFDPRSFATAWASERGVIPPPPATPSRNRRTLVAAIIGALAIAALAAGIAILSTRHGTAQVALASPFKVRPVIAAHRVHPLRPGATVPRFFFPPVRSRLVRVGVDPQPAGWILLVLGLVGTAASLILWQRWWPLRTRYTTA